jgi:D-alanyl-D-alanine carboxypeptidase
VNALSGFLTTRRGDRIAFSILCNNHHLAPKRALEVIDQIVVAAVEQ